MKMNGSAAYCAPRIEVPLHIMICGLGAFIVWCITAKNNEQIQNAVHKQTKKCLKNGGSSHLEQICLHLYTASTFKSHLFRHYMHFRNWI